MEKEENGRSVNFNLKLKSPENIAEVQLLRDGKEYKQFPGNGNDLQISWNVQKQRAGE